MSIKNFILIALLSILTTNLLACEVKVSWESWAPYQTKDNGNPGGLDSELLNAVLADAGCKATYSELPWARQLADSESGNIDIVMAASKSPDREKFANFTAGYRQETISLFVKKGEGLDIKKVADLGTTKAKIGVARGNLYSPEVDAMVAKFDSTADKDETNLKKLLIGRIDGFLVDQFTGFSLIKEAKASDKVEQHPVVISTSDVYFMVSKKTKVADLQQKLTKSIEKLKSNGALDKIILKYK